MIFSCLTHPVATAPPTTARSLKQMPGGWYDRESLARLVREEIARDMARERGEAEEKG